MSDLPLWLEVMILRLLKIARFYGTCAGFGPWVSDPVFLEIRRTLSAGVQQPIRLMELFGGLSSSFIALMTLGLNVELVAYYDINPALVQWISMLHVLSSVIHIGEVAGDIMLIELENLPHVDLLVAGPPCPPWSHVGVRRSWQDQRTQPDTSSLQGVSCPG